MEERGPRTDMEARERVNKEVASRFITPEERCARIEAAMKVKGFKTRNQLAMAIGTYDTSLGRTMTKPNVTITTLARIAVVLGVSINYLTEVDYE